MAVHYTVIESW